MSSSEEDPTTTNASADFTMSRRSAITKVAVGAAAAWTVPMVLAAPAGAQASCTDLEVNWSIWESSLNNLPSSNFDVPVGATGTMTVGFDDTNIGGGTATPGYAQIVPLGTFTSDFISIEMDASAVGESSTLTFTFDQPTQTLGFTLLDVDLGIGDAWQDEVILLASYLGDPVFLNPVDYTFNAFYVEHEDVMSGLDKIGDLFRGIDEASNNTTDANVVLTYQGPIDSLQIIYAAGAAAVDPQPQQIGITDFLYCM